MSAAVHNYLSSLFGLHERSDCTLVFFIPTDSTASALRKRRRDDDALLEHCEAPDTGADLFQIKQLEASPAGAVQSKKPSGRAGARTKTKDTITGNLKSLPAHLVILCGGSELFRAQADRWTKTAGSRGKPVLRVPLDCEEDLLDALAAVRFIYSGKLETTGVAELLRLRRMAAYLQVEGCVQACDLELAGYVLNSVALAGVAEIYACRQQLLDVVEEPIYMQLQHACQNKLLQHSTAPLPKSSVGELLAWAFGDAPSVLSNEKSCENMKALSATALCALLGSEGFATDTEASVLAMLACWVGANPNTASNTRQHLSRQIRLCQLSGAYLHVVVPELNCLSISTSEFRFLCQYVMADDDERSTLLDGAKDVYQCSSAWYLTATRPPAHTPRSYEWSLGKEELLAAIYKNEPNTGLYGKVAGSPEGSVTANGFSWLPKIELRNMGTVGFFLMCKHPENVHRSIAVARPGAVRMVAYKWRGDGSREEAWSFTYDKDVRVGSGRGTLVELASGKQQDVASERLAAWEPYLHDGKVYGALIWE